ncbi:MAG: efflux RND transporter permease subunit [Clostridia bacterium]|mgnify:CR=1 FL=1|nr:efflux RND transporter permease subunit [Clostridia bacterium]
MIGSLLKIRVGNRKVVIFLIVLYGLLGLIGYLLLPQQLILMDKEEATIKVYYPGASAQEVESLVTAKIEEELKGLDGYDYSYSISQRGSALIKLKLNDSINSENKWQQLRGRINNLQDSLPQNVEVLISTEPATSEDFLFTIWNEGGRYTQLIEDAKYIKQEISSLPGLSSIKIIGEQIQEIRVQVDLDKLNHYKEISMKDILKALEMANMSILQTAININDVEVNLNTSKALSSLEDIANTIIYISPESGGAVRVKDVANITWEPKETNEIVKHNGENAILLTGSFKKNTDKIAISQEIESRLIDIQADLSSQTKIDQLFSQSRKLESFSSRDNLTLVDIRTEPGLTLNEKEKKAERISYILGEKHGLDFFTVVIDSEGYAQVWMETDKFHQPALQIRIIGPQEGLAQIVKETKEILKNTPGILNIQDDQSVQRYEYFLDIDYQKAAFLGVKPLEIQEIINLFSQGQIATTVVLEDQKYDVNVKSNLKSIEEIMDLAITSPETGQRVLLKQIAELKLQPQIAHIKKYNGEHTVTVYGDLQGTTSLLEIERLVKAELAKRDLDNYQIHFIKKGQSRTIPLLY